MADTMLRCRMYDNWEEYIRGWKRIYTESANREIKRLRRYAFRTPILTSVFPLLSLALVVLSLLNSFDPVGITIGVVALCCWFIGLITVYRMSHAPVRDVPMSIVGALLTGRIFWVAASDLATGRPTLWGGRTYVRKAEG